MCIYIHINIHIHRYIYVYVYTYTCIRLKQHTRPRTDTDTHTRTHTYTHTHTAPPCVSSDRSTSFCESTHTHSVQSVRAYVRKSLKEVCVLWMFRKDTPQERKKQRIDSRWFYYPIRNRLVPQLETRFVRNFNIWVLSVHTALQRTHMPLKGHTPLERTHVPWKRCVSSGRLKMTHTNWQDTHPLKGHAPLGTHTSFLTTVCPLVDMGWLRSVGSIKL